MHDKASLECIQYRDDEGLFAEDAEQACRSV